MARIRIAPAASLAVLSLSCGVLPLRASLPGPHALPAVSAPAVDALADAPSPTPSAAEDPALAALIREFEDRHTGLSRREIEALAPIVLGEARRHGIELELVLALMHVESGYYNFAVSHVGAMGLMQIMPHTGKSSAGELGIPWRGPRTLFDPQVNVRIGIWYLRQLRDRYGRIEVALAAYNWGPHRIDWRIRNGRELPKLYPTQVREALESRAEALEVVRGRV